MTEDSQTAIMSNSDTITDIIVKPDIDDMDWQEIVNLLFDELSNEDIPDKVIQATEMMIAGWPTYKIARKLNVKTPTVRSWLSKYPTMAAVISEGKKLMSLWRMAQLEQQFLTAVERSNEILELDLSDRDINTKLVGLIGQQARYVIGLFIGQKSNIVVTHEADDALLKAQHDALDYLAQKAQELELDEEPIEVSYRVVDTIMDDTGPMTKADGSPHFGELGEFDTNDQGTMCHICGSRFKDLNRHIISKHNMPVVAYENTFLLEDGSVRGLRNS